jgi:metal-responsive CopG/Arc/MetJ family transcriptional regulator
MPVKAPMRPLPRFVWSWVLSCRLTFKEDFFMLSIDLEPELETTLNVIAQKEHSSPNEIIKRLISDYIKQKQAKEKNNRFIELINSVEPVKTLYSSEQMVAMLREGKEQFLTDAQTNYAK